MFDIEDISEDECDPYNYGYNRMYYSPKPFRPQPVKQKPYDRITANIKRIDNEGKSLISVYAKELEKSEGINDDVKVPKLVDLAAATVGKYCEPHDIVTCDPPMDELLYNKVLANVTPTSMIQMILLESVSKSDDRNTHSAAMDLLRDRMLVSIIQVGFVLIARFGSKSNRSAVTIELGKQQITSVRCDYCKPPGVRGCKHAYATMLYRIYLPSLVKIYPPITDTLSLMNRDDLQRLVQLLLSDEPSTLIDKCHQHIDKLKDKTTQTDNESNQIPDPSVSSFNTCIQLYADTLRPCISGLWDDINLKAFDGFDLNNRDIAKKYLKEAVDLCRLLPQPQHSLPLSYISAVGVLARNAHERQSKGSSEDLIRRSFSFLFNFMESAACVFPQRQNRISIDSIDIEEWKQCLKDCCTSFKENKSCPEFKIKKLMTRKMTPQAFESYEPMMSMLRIYPLYLDKVQKVFGNSVVMGVSYTGLAEPYLSEVIASLFVPPPPEDFIQLISNEDLPPEKSTYDEALPVMMLRANAYDYAELGDDMSEQAVKEKLKIVDKIIMKLGKKSIKYSILSIYCKSRDFEEHIKENQDEPDNNAFAKFLQKALGLPDTPGDHNKSLMDPNRILNVNNANMPSTENQTAKTKSDSTTNTPAQGTRYSLRKRRSSAKLIGFSTPKISSTRTKAALKENSNLLNNVEKLPVDANISPQSSKVEVDKFKISFSVQVPDEHGSRCSPRKRRCSEIPKVPSTPNKKPRIDLKETQCVLNNEDKPADENLSRERLCHLLLHWLLVRHDLSTQLSQYAQDLGDDISPTANIINGIQCLTLELSRFRLTKDEYTAEEQKQLSKMELELFDDLELYACTFQRNWWLYISAWDTLGFDLYGDHFPVAIGSCLSSRQISRYVDTEKHGYDAKVFIGFLGKFLMHELKVQYTCPESVLYYDRNYGKRKPQRWPYETLLMEHLLSEDEGDFYGLCQKVVEECLQSDEKTKVRVLYDAFSAMSDSAYFNKNDDRGHKLKLRIALHLWHVHKDRCPWLSSDIKNTCKHLGDKCLSILEDCSKDTKWKGKSVVVKQCTNIHIGSSLTIVV